MTPIVVVNKIDKPSARPEEVVDEVLELFIELGADDDQLEFPVVYASAINGTSSLSDNPADQEHTMAPIFDTIIDHIPAPVDNSDEPLQFQVLPFQNLTEQQRTSVLLNFSVSLVWNVVKLKKQKLVI